MTNAFESPQHYRNLILKNVAVKAERKPFSGKSFTCVSFTRFCPVGCRFCFFSSSPAEKQKTIADAFTEEGLERFIQFMNEANLGYLLVSGGGEPFMERNCLLNVVERVKSDNIVLVTSGNWAKSRAGAANYVRQIYAAFERRTSPAKVVIRLSVDEEHGSVGLEPAFHLISLFEENYLTQEKFKLQFHTLFDDPCIDNMLHELKDRTVSVEEGQCKSDGDTILKVNPAEKIIKLSSGLEIKVGYAKRFNSNIKVNLNDPEVIAKNLSIFQWDLSESEENNPSVVTNLKGGKGLDFWVNFNGNVTTWGNQVPDNLYNIYEDSYEDVVNGTFADPISLAYLEKGDPYRDRIVREVNPKAAIRAKATNIRDYTGAIICEEEKTRLYLSLRILQDYIKEQRVTPEKVKAWPIEIQQLVALEKAELISLYRKSEHSIVDQYIQRPFNKFEWLDLFELIKCGHYEIGPAIIQKAIGYYNQHVNEPVNSVDNISNKPSGFFHEERIIGMKPTVANRYIPREELALV